MRTESVVFKDNKLNKADTPTLRTIRKMRARIRNIREIKTFMFRLIILVGFLVVQKIQSGHKVSMINIAAKNIHIVFITPYYKMNRI